MPRGRPRKITSDERGASSNDETAITHGGEILKKGRGRPRKQKASSDDDQVVLKRQRIEVSSSFESLKTGVVMTLGQGEFGQLGLGENVMSRKKPALVDLSGKKIKRIVAGGMHTVCLTEDSEVYTFGCNDEGALGRETNDDGEEFEPVLVGGLLKNRKIVDISAGDSHTAALTNDGEVFLWGCFRDSHGKLGLLTEWNGSMEPVKLNTNRHVIKRISSGSDHVAMVTVDGRILTLGCGEQGQLGRISRYFLTRGGRRNAVETAIMNMVSPVKERTEAEEICLEAKAVHMPKARGRSGKLVFSEVYCGSYFTYVMATTGDIYGFGLNNYNQLGIPDAESKYMPEFCLELSEKKWKMISGGQHHSLLLDENGDVYSIGRGEYGRLGLGEGVTQADEPTKIEALSNVVFISAVSCVSFAVTKEGKAYGWGMGTNLQLTTGEETDEWEPVELTGKNLTERFVLEASGGGQHTVLLACDKTENLNGTDAS